MLQTLLEGIDNGVHPADRLQQGRVLIEELAEVELVFPEVRAEQLTEIERIVYFARRQAGMDVLALIPATARAHVEIVCGVQVAIAPEQVEETFFVLSCQRVVQGVPVDRLGQQFGQITARIRHYLPRHYGTALKMLQVVEKGRPVIVGKDFEINAEFLAVAEYGGVVVGNAGRTHIRVQMLLGVKADPLAAVLLPDDIAAASRQIASAGPIGGFQNRALIARF